MKTPQSAHHLSTKKTPIQCFPPSKTAVRPSLCIAAISMSCLDLCPPENASKTPVLCVNKGKSCVPSLYLPSRCETPEYAPSLFERRTALLRKRQLPSQLPIQTSQLKLKKSPKRMSGPMRETGRCESRKLGRTFRRIAN